MNRKDKPPDDASGDDLNSISGGSSLSREELLHLLQSARKMVHNAAQPLTSILTLSELIINSENLDDLLKEDVRTIYEQAFFLKDILHNLQDLVLNTSEE